MDGAGGGKGGVSERREVEGGVGWEGVEEVMNGKERGRGTSGEEGLGQGGKGGGVEERGVEGGEGRVGGWKNGCIAGCCVGRRCSGWGGAVGSSVELASVGGGGV